MNTSCPHTRRGFLKMFFGGAALVGMSGLSVCGAPEIVADSTGAVSPMNRADENTLAVASYDDEFGYDSLGDPGWSY